MRIRMQILSPIFSYKRDQEVTRKITAVTKNIRLLQVKSVDTRTHTVLSAGEFVRNLTIKKTH
jgi:hypothetical protein